MVEKRSLFWIVTVAVLIVDQILKAAIAYAQPQSRFIHLVQNTGAGFGLFKNSTLLLAAISLLVALMVIIQYKKIPANRVVQVLWGLFLGGVVGNLVDRIVRGYVIDFIDVQFWPVFNIADAAITVSVIGLVWYYWKG